MTAPLQLTLLDEREARDLTDRIKATAEQLWTLLLEAHDRQAWHALGYGTWSAYIDAEFDMGRAHAYRLLDQARVIRALEAVVSPDGDTPVHVTEAEARDIKPVLDEVVEEVAARTEAEPDRPPAEVVAEVVEKARAKKRAPDDAEAQAHREQEALEAIGVADSPSIAHMQLLENGYRCVKAVRANLLRLDPEALGRAAAEDALASRDDWQGLADDLAVWHERLLAVYDERAKTPLTVLEGGQR